MRNIRVICNAVILFKVNNVDLSRSFVVTTAICRKVCNFVVAERLQVEKYLLLHNNCN